MCKAEFSLADLVNALATSGIQVGLTTANSRMIIFKLLAQHVVAVAAAKENFILCSL